MTKILSDNTVEVFNVDQGVIDHKRLNDVFELDEDVMSIDCHLRRFKMNGIPHLEIDQIKSSAEKKVFAEIFIWPLT